MRQFFTLLALPVLLADAFGQDFKIAGYLPYYRFELLDQIRFDQLTHLNIAFANPDAAGNLDVSGQDIAPVVERRAGTTLAS